MTSEKRWPPTHFPTVATFCRRMGKYREVETQKTRKKRVQKSTKEKKVPPQGLEQDRKTRVKTAGCGLVPPLVPPSLTIKKEGADQLLRIWTALESVDQAELLAVARRLLLVKSCT